MCVWWPQAARLPRLADTAAVTSIILPPSLSPSSSLHLPLGQGEKWGHLEEKLSGRQSKAGAGMRCATSGCCVIWGPGAGMGAPPGKIREVVPAQADAKHIRGVGV